jgi:tRNA threonylcarbamoyladenosine biosynthesis protein TsaE
MALSMETLIYDITDTNDLAIAGEALLERARVVALDFPNEAVVLALSGDLGAGKTTLVQLLARVLGVTGTVTSPTFVVMKQYDTENETFPQLVHIDAYRIEDIDEMRPLGFTSLLTQPGTLVCIEWAERIAALLPTHTIAATLTVNCDDTRTLTITS